MRKDPLLLVIEIPLVGGIPANQELVEIDKQPEPKSLRVIQDVIFSGKHQVAECDLRPHEEIDNLPSHFRDMSHYPALAVSIL